MFLVLFLLNLPGGTSILKISYLYLYYIITFTYTPHAARPYPPYTCYLLLKVASFVKAYLYFLVNEINLCKTTNFPCVLVVEE